MNRIFLSYIVPCYNIQKYLPRCLDSLSKQRIDSDEEIEFVLVNDGSPDSCLAILRDFAAKERRAIIIDQRNKGVSAARNAGLKVANGRYVFFLDGDDYLTDNASQVIYDVCKENQSDIIVTNAYKVKEGSWNNREEWNPCVNMSDGIYSVEEFVRSISVLPISFKAYHRQLLINNDVCYDEDIKLGEVFSFFIHALQYSDSILVTKKRILNYVVRDSGVMREGNLQRDSTILKTISRMDKYATGPNLDLRDYLSYNAAFYRIVRIFTLNKYVRLTKYTKEIGQLLKKIDGNDIYRKVLRFVASNTKGEKRTFYALGQLYLPTKLYYGILRFLIRMRTDGDVF